jgi:CTP:molybdopterin cytidylyltransferase MocA
MQAVSGDKGARGLLEQFAGEVVAVEMEGEAIFADVDTPDDLAGLT